MNSARKQQQITDTNPRSVLRAISSTCFDLNDTSFESSNEDQRSSFAPVADDHSEEELPNAGLITSDVVSSTDVVSHFDVSPNEDVISLRINPDSNPLDDKEEDILQSTIESAKQVQQLATRLNEFKTELQERESQLEDRVSAWNKSKSTHQTNIERQQQQLAQQSAHVRRQQSQLMQLQSDIVESQQATRQMIESLVFSDSDTSQIETLKALKQQLGERFDFISCRWEHLAELLNKAQMLFAAKEPVDDTVDWAGRLD